ncbi:outer membrane beta-barrel protein [Pseudoalteromonas luteoviolacea]|uniref:Outer membrane protein beta-barrel domain-containing protein n=2 Tax=Pseudoalteromonas luteoviolacea TaxID=43657 RepID=A0A167DZI4_9GAMM|nr:outer membrane beta-barrel protein [Pseudoalteromonas luteoviolacea]KZN49797.1 hypothetical protein N476_18565 [Pseudoalteromonas luteoviolacea H33]KZN77821.1 hypothetical protein N477_01020 [Pseudoalteromonas luteoviolacea H33-S]
MKHAIISASLLTLIALNTHASDTLSKDFYTGAEYSNYEFGHLDLGVATLKGGYKYNDFLSFEVAYGAGVGAFMKEERYYSNPLANYSSTSEYRIEQQVKVKAIGEVPIINNWSAYGYLQMVDTRIQHKFRFKKESEHYQSRKYTYDDGGLGYGLGVKYSFPENWQVSLEYSSLGEFNPIDKNVSGFSLGVNYQF